MSATITEPTDEQVIEACRAFKSREDIEAAGYVPGWHGEPVNVGDLAVIHGHGGWRQAIVTKVTGTYVHGRFTTPSAITEGQRIREMQMSTDPLRVRAQVAKQRGRDWDWQAYVANAQPGDDWHPTDKSYPMKLNDSLIAEKQAWLAKNPDRDQFVDAEADREADRASKGARYARERGAAAYVNITNGKGDRTGKRTNLYVLPR